MYTTVCISSLCKQDSESLDKENSSRSFLLPYCVCLVMIARVCNLLAHGVLLLITAIMQVNYHLRYISFVFKERLERADNVKDDVMNDSD